MEKGSVPIRRLLITVDGPAGVGKSTVSKRLAVRLGYSYLDTGAFYRAKAWKVQQEQLDLNNLTQVQLFLSHTQLQLTTGPDGLSLSIDGQVLGQEELRVPAISQLASSVAALPAIREWLLPLQQEVGKARGVVAEGRDMGTRVFPDADVKFFLEADLAVRARRRAQEFQQKGEEVFFETVKEEMAVRDRRDRNRPLAPLRPAPEAIMVDTSRQSVEEVVEYMMEHIADRS